MVLTRNSTKHSKKAKAGTSKSVLTQQSDEDETMKDEEAEKELENIKLVASLVNWDSYDAVMGKIFYQKFGKVLEKTLADFEENKKDLKDCIRKATDNTKAMQTPKKMKPAAALQEQIKKFRELNFDTDDEDMNAKDEDKTLTLNAKPQHRHPEPDKAAPQVVKQPNLPPQILKTPQKDQPCSTATANRNSEATVMEKTPPPASLATPEYIQIAEDRDVEDVVMAMATPEQPKRMEMEVQTPQQPQISTPSTPAVPLMKKQKLGTPYQRLPPIMSSNSMKKLAISNKMNTIGGTPVQMASFVELATGTGTMEQPKRTPGRQPMDTTFQKKAKLNEIGMKAAQAEKIRKEQLQEKAERTKREQQERAKRAEQNRLKKEQERLEKEEKARQEQARVKDFIEKQKEPKAVVASPRKIITPKKTATTAKKGGTSQNQKKKAPAIMTAATSSIATALFTAKQQPEHRLHNNQENQVPVSVQSTTRMQTPPLSPIQPNDNDNMEVFEDQVEEVSAYDLTKEKVFLPSTEDNYNVDDLSSADETDNDEKPRKTVPKWAKKENIMRYIGTMRNVLTVDQAEKHFGKIHQPTLQGLFKGNAKKYPPRRASSAIWNSPMSDPTPGVGRYQKL